MRVTTIRWWAAAALGLAVAGAAWGDEIELKDGRKFSGKVVTQGTRVVITTDDGGTVETRSDNVQSVRQVGRMTRDELAAAEWKRVAAAGKMASDIQSVIVLHERFLRQYKDTASAEAAQQSLDMYRGLVDAGAVKYRGTWMTAAEFEAVRKGWKESAAPAVAFYRGGQLKEAQNAVAAVLAKEPQNQEALAVAGMAAYRLNSMTLAQRYFALLAESPPPNVMGPHNQAVLCAARKDWPNAVKQYTQALQILPSHRLLLDNVTELMHALPEPEKKQVGYKALQQAYEQAEAKLEGEMLKDNLYRWGSTWVSEQQLAKLSRVYDEVREEMQALDGRYKAARIMLPQLDEQITRAREEVTSLQGQVMTGALLNNGARGQDMSIVSRNSVLKQSLAESRQRLSELEIRRTEMQGQIVEMQGKAQRLKVKLGEVEPQFTGLHRIMDLGEEEKPPPFAAVNVKEDTQFSK
jgi:tetratricopeptide (TPR) repeat protein